MSYENRQHIMQKHIKKAEEFVLKAKVQPNASWKHNLLALNKSEMGSSESFRKEKKGLRKAQRELLDKRDRYVSQFFMNVRNSQPGTAREIHIKQLLKLIYSLQEVNVKEVALLGKNGVRAVIGEEAFRLNVQEAIPSVTKSTPSRSSVQEIIAVGTNDPIEIIEEDESVARLAFLLLIANAFHGEWSIPCLISRSGIEDIKIEVSWMTKEEIKAMSQISVSKFLAFTEPSRSQPPAAIIVGMRTSAKSKTRSLLTRNGKGDGGSQISYKPVQFESQIDQLIVWETPGRDKSGVAKNTQMELVKHKLMQINTIASVICQGDKPDKPTDKELEMLKEYTDSFGPLKDNLIVVLGPSSNDEHARRHIKAWEDALQEKGVGKIGSNNYITYSTEASNRGTEASKEQRRKIMQVLERKKTSPIVAQKGATSEIEKIAQVQDDRVAQAIMDSQGSKQEDESVIRFKELLESAVKVVPKYNKKIGTLKLTLVPEKKAQDSKMLRIGKGAEAKEFTLVPNCDKVRTFLIGYEKSQRKEWVRQLCMKGGPYIIIPLTRATGVAGVTFDVFANQVVGEDAIKRIVPYLGAIRAREIFKYEGSH